MRPESDVPNYATTITHSEERTVVTIVGELDLATAADFEATVRGHAGAGPIVLDLSEMSFIDSSGIRALDSLIRDMEVRPKLTVRASFQEPVRQMLELTLMYDQLPLAVDDEQ